MDRMIETDASSLGLRQLDSIWWILSAAIFIALIWEFAGLFFGLSEQLMRCWFRQRRLYRRTLGRARSSNSFPRGHLAPPGDGRHHDHPIGMPRGAVRHQEEEDS